MSDHLPIRSIHLEPNHSHNVDDAMPAPRARGLLSEPKDPKTTSRMRVGPLARSESDEDAPSKESSPGCEATRRRKSDITAFLHAHPIDFRLTTAKDRAQQLVTAGFDTVETVR